MTILMILLLPFHPPCCTCCLPVLKLHLFLPAFIFITFILMRKNLHYEFYCFHTIQELGLCRECDIDVLASYYCLHTQVYNKLKRTNLIDCKANQDQKLVFRRRFLNSNFLHLRRGRAASLIRNFGGIWKSLAPHHFCSLSLHSDCLYILKHDIQNWTLHCQ